jgi:hypothetical protein
LIRIVSHSYKSLLNLIFNYLIINTFFLPRVRVRVRARVRVRVGVMVRVRVRVRARVRVDTRVMVWG